MVDPEFDAVIDLGLDSNRLGGSCAYYVVCCDSESFKTGKFVTVLVTDRICAEI